jgi:hypothetical protein
VQQTLERWNQDRFKLGMATAYPTRREELNVKTIVIAALAALVSLPATSAAPTEPAIQEAAPVMADPVAGTPTPPAE